jgi:hypothetical protein
VDSLRNTIQGVRAAGSEEHRQLEELKYLNTALLDAVQRVDDTDARASATAASLAATQERLKLTEAELARAVADAASADTSSALQLLHV